MKLSTERDRVADKRLSRRALLLGLVEAAGLGVVATRLYQIQVMDSRHYAPLAEDNRIDIEAVPAVRGRIFDRAGTLLAGNEEGFRLNIRPLPEGELRRVLELVSRVVPMSEAERNDILERARRLKAGTAMVAVGELTFDQVAAINLLAPQLPGVETETAHRRVYSTGRQAGHVTGYVGRVEHHALDDDAALRLASMKVGKSGIERGMEMELRGRSGARRFEVDARGRVVRYLDELDPVAGRDVVLSLDMKLQTKVVERLEHERRASLVVLDIATGEVMAMASVPGYDPAEFAGKVAPDTWRMLATGADQPLLNRAISGSYPPGSTFKMATALAALSAGKFKPNERIECSGSFTLADQTFRCWNRHGHGRADLHRAIRESCDVYFYTLASRTGVNAIAAMARKLGLGQIYDCGLPAQKKGVIPDTDWKRTRLRRGWLDGETILAGIGQGYVSTTPLQLAVMIARIASGRRVVPQLERHAEPKAVAFEPLDVDVQWLEVVRRGLVAAVNESGGTGANAALEPGRPIVAGKTGTSQVSRALGADETTDLAWEHQDHALFVSYFPADAPRYAIAAVVEHGGGGGATAAPLVKDVIEFILADDPALRPPPAEAAKTRQAGPEPSAPRRRPA